jgi:serine/threonine-protein kinase
MPNHEVAMPDDRDDRERRLDEILGAFLADEAKGLAPSPSELIAGHPELARELTSFFADRRKVQCLLEPLLPPQAAATAAPAAAQDPTRTQTADVGPAEDAGTAAPDGDGRGRAAEPGIGGLPRSFGKTSGGDVLETIAAAVGPVPRVLLRDTDAAPGASVFRPGRDTGADPSVRYRIDGEIARGGMGAVLKGFDADLCRDVALKVLREDFLDNHELVRRFVEEAQIGGQLQHPGLVPIYELGTLSDRRPFLAMKLVKGQTFAALLEARPSPASELPRFVGIFQQVCQTVAYAHARGVIHRDLKPSNVMVGGFGEVQVMDWGLAKILDRSEGGGGAPASVPGDTVVQTSRTYWLEGASMPGEVLGTPAYMAPEQARGEIHREDTRCDVFGLGSILCEILTGRPAFTGPNVLEIQRRAAQGELSEAFIRLDACGQDPELVTLARDCLAPDRELRPRDAGVVSDRIAAYENGLEQRFRMAELERAAEQARAEEAARRAAVERQRRRLTVLLAATIIAMLTLGVGSWAFQARQRAERIAVATRAVSRALSDAQLLLGQARASASGDLSKWTEAMAAARGAASLLAGSEVDAVTRTQIQAAIRSLLDEGQVAEARIAAEKADRRMLDQLAAIRQGLDYLVEQRRIGEVRFAAAFRDYGIDVDRLPPAEAGAMIASRPTAVELVAAIDEWTFNRRSLNEEAGANRLMMVARAADPDPWRTQTREALARRDLPALLQRASTIDLDKVPPYTAQRLGHGLVELGEPRRAVSLLRALQRRNPGDYWITIDLIHALSALKPPPHEEIIRYFSVILALAPKSINGHRMLAEALLAAGRNEEAFETLHEAIRLRPRVAEVHANLARALAEVGKRDEALDKYRAASRLEPNDVRAHTDLAKALSTAGRQDEALAAVRAAIRLAPDDGWAQQVLGSILLTKRDWDGAAKAFRAAIQHGGKQDANAQHDLGVALQESGRIEEAITAYGEAVRIQPKSVRAHADLAKALSMAGRQDEALAEYRAASRLEPKDVRGHTDLAKALSMAGRQDEALAAVRQAIRLAPNDGWAQQVLGSILMIKRDWDGAATAFRAAIGHGQGQDANAHRDLGECLLQLGRTEEAITAYRGATRLDPDDAWAHGKLGSCLLALGKFEESIAAGRRALAIDNRLEWVHMDLAWACRWLGRLEESIAEFRKAIRLNPDFDVAHEGLIDTLRTAGRPDEAVPIYREALRLRPGDDRAHAHYARALKQVGRLGEAAAEAREAVRRRPDSGRHHNLLAWILLTNRDWDAAAAAYREAIRLGQDQDPWAHHELALALRSQGRLGEAIPEFQHARKVGLPGLPIAFAIKSDMAATERQRTIADRLPAVIRGDDGPADPKDLLDFAYLCYDRDLHASAARLFARAFEADPKLAADLAAHHRYNAACNVALLLAGRSKDDPPRDPICRARLRMQALGWLRADLTSLTHQLKAGTLEAQADVRATLRDWKFGRFGPDLAGVRDPEALTKLPETERKDWQTLWAEVDALLQRARSDSAE